MHIIDGMAALSLRPCLLTSMPATRLTLTGGAICAHTPGLPGFPGPCQLTDLCVMQDGVAEIAALPVTTHGTVSDASACDLLLTCSPARKVRSTVLPVT